VIRVLVGLAEKSPGDLSGRSDEQALGPKLDFVCWKMRREYNQTSYGYDGRTNSADVIGRPG
jgi:hypothetical protein